MSKALRSALQALALAVLAMGSRAEAAGWRDIDCAESRLVTRASYANVRCFHQSHHGDDYQGQFDFFGMEVKQAGLYVNVALRMAGPRSYVYLQSYPDMKAFTLAYFSWLPGHTSGWSEAQRRDGLHFIGFSYKSSPCFAFERGEEARDRGYKHAFTGLVCRMDGGSLEVQEFKAIALGFTHN